MARVSTIAFVLATYHAVFVTAQITYGAPTDLTALTSSSTTTTSTTTTSSSSSTGDSTTSLGTTSPGPYSYTPIFNTSDTSLAPWPSLTLSSSPSPSPSTDLSKFYVQKTRDQHLQYLSPSQLLEADLAELCPSGNCLEACQNRRVYEVVPQGISIPYDQYGTLNSTYTEVTLFGICADISSVTNILAGGGVPEEQAKLLRPYFPKDDSTLAKVAENITQCLPASCAKSRDSGTCAPWCQESDLLSDDGSTNVVAVAECLEWLCEESCGLPYANQDVVGIGVSISYVIQAVLVIVCWVALMLSSWHHYRSHKSEHEWRDVLLESVGGFLIAQDYFGIPLGIAALTLDPFKVDPLNGYGLLAVSISGFLPQIFTLMMLHAYGKRSWYLSLLTCVSWLLASIVFWSLHTNLMGDVAGEDSSFRSLYNIPTCGGSGATALCWQTTSRNPLSFLQDYYYHSAIPGIKSVPMLWAWSSFVLFVLMISQCIHGTAVLPKGSLQSLRPRSGTFYKKACTSISTAASSTPAYVLASTIFFLSIAYQALMFYTYIASFINSHDWAFGQVIAITLWAAPLLDYFHAQIKHSREKDEGHRSSTLPLKHQSLASVSTTYSASRPNSISVPGPQYQPLNSPYQTSPDPAGDFGFAQQAGYEARYDAPATGTDRHDEFELRTRPTLRMEEGNGQQGREPIRRKPVGFSPL